MTTTITTLNITLDPSLEDGAQPTTPPGDNLVADFMAADSAAFRALAAQAGGRSTVDDELGLSMGDAGSPCPFGNVAHATRPLTAPAVAEAVRRLHRFYRTAPGGPFLIFTPWSLGDLRDDGFDIAGHPPLMIRAAGIELPNPGSCRIVRVSDGPAVADFDRTLAEAYPADALLPYGTQPVLVTEGVLETPWQLVTGYVGDQPVATAGAYATDQVVAVEAVSTRPGFRRQGIGGLVTAAAAATAPNVPAALLSSDAGRHVYEMLGFIAVSRFTLWVGNR